MRQFENAEKTAASWPETKKIAAGVKMSEKKGVFISVPEGYEVCDIYSSPTHVLVGRNSVFEIDRNNLGNCAYKEVGTNLYKNIDVWNIVAWLRELPKPERFRAVLDIEAESVEPRGLESNWKDFENGVKCACFAFRENQGIRPGQLYRVTIEEIDSDGVEILAKETPVSLQEIAQREVLKPSKENYDV